MTVISFLGFLFLFLLVGVASFLRSRNAKEDYYLASKDVSPMFVGLSAVATNNSGYMFIGVIGYTYAVGLASIWLMIGWIAGDFLASLYVHRQLRISTEKTGELTFSGVLSRWDGGNYKYVRLIAALITVVFLGAYAAAQLSAGGKALHAIFGWPEASGAVLAAVAVAIYCLAGGLRASIWTDVAQSFVMLFAMGLLLVVAILGLGGPARAVSMMGEVDGFLDLFPSDLVVPGLSGMALFVIGWMFAGLSVIGQPHIMVRFMTLDRPEHISRARGWYYSFFLAFYLMATGVGMLSRIYLPELSGLDPELALPTMAQKLLPPVFVGLILAGIFAATMSTADSLILSCSSALTHDLLPKGLETTLQIKVATILVAAFALAIALSGNQSVFSLVILAWSVLASAFAPLLIMYAIGKRVSEGQAIVMMLTGVSVALLWRYLEWHNSIYEGMPGILAGLLMFYLYRLLAARR
ncbi:MAG: sodium/proline symporter [Parvibaculaceae bacterium]|nr:sodium/proline symporter [Parvibaculaceae bacterium]